MAAELPAASMALGGQAYAYTEQDWSGLFQADLSDALDETAERARHHLAEGLAFFEGLTRLAGHASPELLIRLKLGSPFLAAMLSAGPTARLPVV